MLTKDYYQRCRTYRQDLHQIPEIGFDLEKTSHYLKNILHSLGYQTLDVAKSGVLAVMRGISEEAVAFRADMDALRVTEMNDISFKSLHEGSMHACGHDGHMAILLGFAHFLSTISKPKKTIVLIFQPAEEGPGGAKKIIEEGIFEQFKIKSIFGFHLFPGLEEGKIGLVNKAMMAQNGEFDIVIEGTSSHGAQPHLGCDAILAASELISAYQSIVSRTLNPFAPAVVSVGTIRGGEARNIIANKVLISGTIRSFDPVQYQFIKTRIKEIDQAISLIHRVKVNNSIVDYYPPVINDSHLFKIVKESLPQDEIELIQPMMFAEDFAFYQQVVPGLFMMIGTKNEEKGYIHPLHSCYFNFDEKVLVKGVETYLKICNIFDVI